MKQPKTSQSNLPLPPQGQSTDISERDNATLELLASWRRQDATTDAEQICAAERELAEFKRTMNENRVAAGDPILYP